ncbi:Regulatory subunit of type II PKA R-subunit family protein [Brugia pahangi]
MAESSNENYKVPIGLRPLLEAFVRETLRTQPTDLVSFSILFFNVLQKHRKPPLPTVATHMVLKRKVIHSFIIKQELTAQNLRIVIWPNLRKKA